MPVLKRRSRQISFRVSEGEYLHLKKLCVRKGERSLSDFIRNGVERLLRHNQTPGLEEVPAATVDQLSRRIAELERNLQTLTILIQKNHSN